MRREAVRPAKPAPTIATFGLGLLFVAAHLPSPILTTFTLVGGLFFCEMFRRYRSIYPIGIVHAVLGLTIAVTMPDSVLHHMRVGIGYLRY
jgi:membrane protease YdiL (CAAX protease family)